MEETPLTGSRGGRLRRETQVEQDGQEAAEPCAHQAVEEAGHISAAAKKPVGEGGSVGEAPHPHVDDQAERGQ
jgi:hypothetical protein